MQPWKQSVEDSPLYDLTPPTNISETLEYGPYLLLVVINNVKYGEPAVRKENKYGSSFNTEPVKLFGSLNSKPYCEFVYVFQLAVWVFAV